MVRLLQDRAEIGFGMEIAVAPPAGCELVGLVDQWSKRMFRRFLGSIAIEANAAARTRRASTSSSIRGLYFRADVPLSILYVIQFN
jgi:hypothetical protein